MTVFDEEGRWRNENCAHRKPFICYDDRVILIKEKMNWKDALSYCRNHHHDLVTITNLDEQRWVQEKAKNASTPFVWMGLRYNGTGVWFWVCKESLVSNTSQASERWTNDHHISGAMDAGGQHRWFQRNDTEELNFICSKV
ncbi:L-selectin-like [Fundulus heteroclitus]|uniref:L-selectin-like n=1 Tax=Fundulus heteroclitus TaxID=8078 RepID=UPI00165C8CE7|nr:L-selectin-like [Fundulus heteroclitus]XP_036001921.1 L-selectin-like [Fundulus heteroclitus]